MPFANGFSSTKVPQNTTVCVGARERDAVAAAGAGVGAEAVGTDAGAVTGVAAHAPSATPNRHVAMVRSGFLVCVVGGLFGGLNSVRPRRLSSATFLRWTMLRPLLTQSA